MIVDLHAHYPMHLVAGNTVTLMTDRHRKQWRDRIRAMALDWANRLANYPTAIGPAVTIANLRAGNVGVALSVLYAPFDEIDLDKPYGALPSPSYCADLKSQIRTVEKDIATHFGNLAAVAHNHEQLDAAIAQHKVALIHAVEGGFHLGDTAEHVRANVHELAACGVAYITVAHLFWRGVATNAPALPFLPDGMYRLLFPQPAVGLSALGVAAVEAMVEAHVLIDLTHMNAQAIADTLKVLDNLDPTRKVPVIATHSACRFGGLEYSLTDPHIKAIAERGGVIGLIACEHYMADGGTKPLDFDESVGVICRHIDRIHEVTQSHDHAAFGSDLDGFIKPTLAGLETAAGFATVEERLGTRYGIDAAAKICSGNAMRALSYWKGSS